MAWLKCKQTFFLKEKLNKYIQEYYFSPLSQLPLLAKYRQYTMQTQSIIFLIVKCLIFFFCISKNCFNR